jgi:hypothetical protein
MILELLKCIHFAFGPISLYTGIITLLQIFAGQPFEASAVIFLKSALATCVTGLLFPSHVFQSTQLAAMAAIYVAGLAVLAWRRFHLTRIWGLVFALSLLTVLAWKFLLLSGIFSIICRCCVRQIQPEQSYCSWAQNRLSCFFFRPSGYSLRAGIGISRATPYRRRENECIWFITLFRQL